MATFINEDLSVAEYEAAHDRALLNFVGDLHDYWNSIPEEELQMPGIGNAVVDDFSNGVRVPAPTDNGTDRLYFSDALKMQTRGALSLANTVIVRLGRIKDMYTKSGLADTQNMCGEVDQVFQFMIDAGVYNSQLIDFYVDRNVRLVGRVVIDKNNTSIAMKYLEEYDPTLVDRINGSGGE